MFLVFRIRVVAHNAKGEANVSPEEFIGYSGEDVPAEAPTNFTLNEVVGPRSAVVSWNPVNENSIRGDFKGYKIQTWTQKSGEEKFREIIMKCILIFFIFLQSFFPIGLPNHQLSYGCVTKLASTNRHFSTAKQGCGSHAALLRRAQSLATY